MPYIHTMIALFGGVYAISYGIWLKKQGNSAGAIIVFLLAFASMALPVWRLFKRL